MYTSSKMANRNECIVNSTTKSDYAKRILKSNIKLSGDDNNKNGRRTHFSNESSRTAYTKHTYKHIRKSLTSIRQNWAHIFCKLAEKCTGVVIEEAKGTTAMAFYLVQELRVCVFEYIECAWYFSRCCFCLSRILIASAIAYETCNPIAYLHS